MSVNCILQGQGKWHPPMSNPNLLDNWYFVDPINQRGQTEYTQPGYTIDRWHFGAIVGDRLALSDGYITITKTSSTSDSEFILIEQKNVEHYKDLSGQTITFSVLLSNGLVSGSGTVPVGDDDQEHWVIQSVSNGIDIRVFKSGNRKDVVSQILLFNQTSINIKAAKLELGTQQTLAHQDKDGNWVLNDPPPNKQQELAKCQRYYEQSVWSCGFAKPVSTSLIRISFTYFFKTKKRVFPAVTVNSNPTSALTVLDVTTNTYLEGCTLEVPTAVNADMISPQVSDPQNRFDVSHIYQLWVPDNSYLISADL